MKPMPAWRESAEFAYLNVLPSAVIAVDHSLSVLFMNQAAEMLFDISIQQTKDKPLAALPGFDDTLVGYCQRVLAACEEISLFEQLLRLPLNHRTVTLHITPVIGDLSHEKALSANQLLITIEKTDGLDRLAGSLWKQEATRAAGVMAAMMAHEVKNPLSGIRGAAQLLRDEVSIEHQALTELICMETDRIRDLLAQVEIFANGVVEHKQAVNIHEVLQYVISIAQTGFAQHVTFKEKYDPSLPDVLAHRDLLVQMFLNLIKNSAEVLTGNSEATITISTNYRSGYRRLILPSSLEGEGGGTRLRVGGQPRVTSSKDTPHLQPSAPNPIPQGGREFSISLPVMVTIEDNGPGIPEHIREHLFEPFVSSKEEGRGLGLSVVAKIASDLGIVVELDQEYQSGTRFIVWLAVT